MEVAAAPATHDGGPSVREVLGADEVAALKKKLGQFLTEDEYADWRKGLAGALTTVPWPAAVRAVLDLVGVFLDMPFAPPLQKLYAESDIVRRYLDPAAYDPEETVVVELAEHTVETSRHPRLDVTVNGAPVGALTFDIEIALVFKGLVLTVRDARIRAIEPGSCVGTGTVSLYGKTLAKRESVPIRLPPVELGGGVPIAP